MEVMVEGEEISEQEFNNGSWTTLAAQRWCARRSPRLDKNETLAERNAADHERSERGRSRFRARPPPLPKRKPLPRLPLDDYKIILRPQTAANLLHYGAASLFQAVCVAAQLKPEEAVAEDQLRIHPTNNTALVSTPSIARADRYIKLQGIIVEQQEIRLFAYAPAPENSNKGILHSACSNEDDAAIFSELRARNKDVEIIGARRLGKSRHIVVIFAGDSKPEYLRYWGATYIVRPFRNRIEACFNCRRVGHRADVCPQERKLRCRRCGEDTHTTPEWGTKAICVARCIICKGGHPTGSRSCEFKFYTQVQQHKSKKTQSMNANGYEPPPRNSQAPTHEIGQNDKTIHFEKQRGSPNTGYRDAVQGKTSQTSRQVQPESAPCGRSSGAGSGRSSSRGPAAGRGRSASSGRRTGRGASQDKGASRGRATSRGRESSIGRGANHSTSQARDYRRSGSGAAEKHPDDTRDLQTAPSGTKEDNEMVRGLIAEVRELRKQLEIANNKIKTLEHQAPARPTPKAKEIVACVRA